MAKYSDTGAIRKILATYKRIAAVGISENILLPSSAVPRYLKAHGFEIIPVNPKLRKWEGLKAYGDLEQIPGNVDIVLNFLAVEHLMGLAKAAVKIKAKVLWAGEGVVSKEAALYGKKHHLTVIMGRCIMKEHRLLNSKSKRKKVPCW
ncbi:MAG: CoA-binding protein [Candidatus Micrarchaeota archaeon]